jgi:hypothetical protein
MKSVASSPADASSPRMKPKAMWVAESQPDT